jgi:hypothetical protein
MWSFTFFVLSLSHTHIALASSFALVHRSHSRARADVDMGSHTWSYFFGPSTVTVSCIRAMIDNDYFDEGMGHDPGKETIPEPQSDKAVVFEEFFTAGLRMPPHPVLSDILLKF